MHLQPNDLAQRYLTAAASFIVASVLICLAVWKFQNTATVVAFMVLAVVLTIVGVTTMSGQHVKIASFGVGPSKVVLEYYEHAQSLAGSIHVRSLDEVTKAEKESVARELQKEHPLPGDSAPRFSAVAQSNASDLLVRPSAYPMTPMYLLDNAFRILDWNEAFTIAFDRTMEGRKGRGVLEWTYFLDNYEEVLTHGVTAFGDTNKLPAIDIEPIRYTSDRYGPLTAVKRAYQIPDDDGACLAWLVTLDMKFLNPSQEVAYRQDLIKLLGLDLMWSEYAISYDRVLNNTRMYPDLLERLLGGHGGIRPIPDDGRVLDLGAGTGNLTYRLIAPARDRVVFAADNNRIMLEFLRSKCQRFLRTAADGGGVIALKQDITSLFGLEDNYFDVAILNNVLYAVSDAKACLEEVHRVLKPGGELRLSGPRNDTNIDVVFERIHAELRECGKLSEVEADYTHVSQINKMKLSPWLYRWSSKDVQEMILSAGFSTILHSSEDVYAGQSMLLCAQK